MRTIRPLARLALLPVFALDRGVRISNLSILVFGLLTGKESRLVQLDLGNVNALLLSLGDTRLFSLGRIRLKPIFLQLCLIDVFLLQEPHVGAQATVSRRNLGFQFISQRVKVHRK